MIWLMVGLFGPRDAVGLFGPRAVVGLRWTDGWFRFCVFDLEKYKRLFWFNIDKPF